ncbi:MAG: hypothetical protein R3Y36_02500, partial [Spirochaetales bacterium]
MRKKLPALASKVIHKALGIVGAGLCPVLSRAKNETPKSPPLKNRNAIFYTNAQKIRELSSG